MQCPKCGSPYAHVFTHWQVEMSELYNLDTCELVRFEQGTNTPNKVINTLKTVECKDCGNKYRITPEIYEEVRN